MKVLALAAALAVPAPPHVLPHPGTRSATKGTVPFVASWLVGARPGAARRVEALGGRQILPGSFEVPASAARAIAARVHLTYSEPNVPRTLAQRAVPDDPLTAASRWRDAVIDPSLAPPPVGADSPLLALVDAKADTSLPEFQGSNARSLPGRTVAASHGTETLGVAMAPQNGVGIVGAYPNARAINVPLPADRITCADSAGGIRRAVAAGAAVINMSYGSTGFCETEYRALQFATHKGVTLVAAGGNERGQGNPYEFPASLPHVLTIGALTPRDKAAFFSNTSAALDLVAPGVGLIAPLPPRLDTHDDARDGYEVVDGTSFAAPIVAAAAIWVRTLRPALTVDQVSQAIRLSATDIARKGWDSSTGYGKLDLKRALTIKPQPVDPLEPNEDFRFVNGQAYGHPAKPIWTGGAPVRIHALIDLFEDPSDVYRIRIPAHHSVAIRLRPQFGNPDLDVYEGHAPTVARDKGLLARSRHKRGQDAARIRNAGSRPHFIYAQVYASGRHPLDSRYTLSVS